MPKTVAHTQRRHQRVRKAQADVRTKAALLLRSYQKSFQRLQKGLKALLMITQA